MGELGKTFSSFRNPFSDSKPAEPLVDRQESAKPSVFAGLLKKLADWHEGCLRVTESFWEGDAMNRCMRQPPRSVSLRRGPHVLLLALSAAIFFPLTATANTITVTRSGSIPLLGDDTFSATVTTTFEWDQGCTGTEADPCQLGITLSYDSSNGISSQGQTLAGVLWEPLGTADFRPGPPPPSPTGPFNYGGVVGAASLIGDAAGTALNFLANVTIGNTTLVNVTSHWGLNPALALNGYGSHLLSSVGSVLEGFGGSSSALGNGHLFGNSPSSVEPSPPNGSSFGLVDPGATNATFDTGFGGDGKAFVQSAIRANVYYINTLDDIDTNLVLPIFGTQGLPIPEPSTAILLGFGLLSLLGMGRRVGSRRS
jgi:hypothetical protein